MGKNQNFSLAFEGDVYRLRTSVGEFDVPAFLTSRERMDKLANVLDDCAQEGVSDKAFLKRLEKEAGLQEEERAEGETTLLQLYDRLRELHDHGLNGVWARIIKNAFAPLFLDLCDYVVGNPPWVNWEHLPDDYRRNTKQLWEHYGLFPHGGMDTILGKGKKDISMLMTYVAADRYLKRGGKLGFVLSQSLFKTSGAGQGFRRFMLPDKTPFGPLVVEDMVELKPFEGANNRTAVAVFAKGRVVNYPVGYQYWKKRESGRGSTIGFDTPYEAVTRDKITFRVWHAEPVNRSDKTSAWIAARKNALHALHNLLGSSPYGAHEGSNTGGANGIYWVEITGARPGGLAMIANITEGAKRKAASTQAAVETALLYPLLRGRDVSRWTAKPSAHILMTQDPETRRGIAEEIMETEYPKAHAYLKKFERELRQRRDRGTRGILEKGGPFWSIFAVAGYTLAPWKVVWREVAHELGAAVVGNGDIAGKEKPVIPDHTCILVECRSEDEAHYLCAALNSSPVRLAVRNYIVLHPDPHVLNNINVPRYSSRDSVHIALAGFSKSAHQAAAQSRDNEVKAVEEAIDREAAKLWGLSDQELAEITHSLREL